MKKMFLCGLIAVVAASCATQTQIIPQAVNTVNSVSLSELNLERKDYKILNTVSAEAIVYYSEGVDGSYTIACPDEGFALKYVQKKEKHGGGWQCYYKGIAKLGYLSNDYTYSDAAMSPEQVARRLAIYRLINQSKLAGADGVIEPVVSTSVDNGDAKKSREIIFKTTVSAKLIKLNTNK